MKYNKLIAVSALLYGAQALRLEQEYINQNTLLQQGDISLN